MLRILTRAALVALLLVPALPAVVSAAYPQSCQTGTMDYYQRYAAKYWPGAPYLLYTGSHGETRVRDLSPCTSPSQSKWGWVGVWGANLDNYGIGGDGFVQLGYVETSDVCCINGLPANSRRFVYTSDDDAGGDFVEATWAGTPQVGVRYEFKIYSTTASGSRIWMYCIQNIDSGGPELCRSRPASWYKGARSMHMFETRNSHDQLGNGLYEPTTLIVQMMYLTENGEWWYYDPSSCSSGGPSQPDYRCVDAGTNDIRGYTYE